MTLTLAQSYHRTQDLSGLLKAAASALADCEDDAAAKAHIASIAAEAVEKAKANLAALEQERDDLAEHIATLVKQIGVAPIADETPRADDYWPEAQQEVDALHAAHAAKPIDLAAHGLLEPEFANAFDRFGSYPNGDDSKLNAAFQDAVTP